VDVEMTKAKGYLLDAAVIVQLFHTLLWLLRFFQYPEQKDWIAVLWGVPYGFVWQIIAFAIEIKLLMDINRRRPWAWCVLFTLLIHSSFYITFAWYFQNAQLKIVMGLIIAALPVVFAVLLRDRPAFSINRRYLVSICVATILFGAIVIIERYMNNHGVIDFAVAVPPWSDFFLLSLLNQPSEFSLLIYWSCYGIVVGVTGWIWSTPANGVLGEKE
jgi:hypothetical protein